MSDNDRKPFTFAPSQVWEGNDGTWSTFIVRVGTPAQLFRVIPSLQGSQTLIPLPEGCTQSDPDDYSQQRGVYDFEGRKSPGFRTNLSTTWKTVGLYKLSLGTNLDFSGNAHFGFDVVGLMVQNAGGLTLENQVVGGIATKDFYLGVFGLGVKPTNFSGFDHPQPSFIQTMKNQALIPSLSLAYTAGASYRIPKLPGSLVLGGYDSSRFTANEKKFPFAEDDDRVLSIGIQAITLTNTVKGTVSPLDRPILSSIDTTSPHIWLPKSTCDQLEAAFGLIYDQETDLYLVNHTMRERLLTLRPTMIFTFGNDKNPADMVTITLPYASFDLQASHPFYPNNTNYFPIRRAANDTQYTLGRTFLQEAYVIADYERSEFSIHQALFRSHMPDQNIVTIPSSSEPPNSSSNGHTQNDTGLPKKMIIGLGVGLGYFFVTSFLLLLFLYSRRKRKHDVQPSTEDLPKALPSMPEVDAQGVYEVHTSPAEIPTTCSEGYGAWEVDAAAQCILLSDDLGSGPQGHELHGNGENTNEPRATLAENVT